MKIHILSDLHLESNPGYVPAAVDADVIVLAGDICTGTRGVEWANGISSAPVVYVLGNHEYYGKHFDQLVAKCKASAAPHVHVLERDTVHIDGIRFLGASLWTDFLLFGTEHRPEAMRAAGACMNDYRRIRVARRGYRRLTPADTLSAHVDTLRWLDAELPRTASSTVVVSHHAPHRGSLAARFASDLVSAAYASSLDAYLGTVPLWIHGHMHDSFDYRVGATRIVCNPLGYPGEFNPAFCAKFVVEVD